MRGVRGKIDRARRKGECTGLAVETRQGRTLVNPCLVVCGVCDMRRTTNRWRNRRTSGVSEIPSNRGSDCRIGVGA